LTKERQAYLKQKTYTFFKTMYFSSTMWWQECSLLKLKQIWFKTIDYLKVHRYRRSGPLLFGIGFEQFNFCRELSLLQTSHSLDSAIQKILICWFKFKYLFLLPNDGILRGLVLCLPLEANKLDSRGVEGSGDFDFDLLAKQGLFEVGFEHHFHLHFCSTDFSDKRNYTEWQRNVFGCTISAKYEFVSNYFIILWLRIIYLINSNSPSGGMKLIECSVSNFDNLTHWWNWQSSITTTGFPDRAGSSVVMVLPFDSMTILSLIPNLHSGIPER
jgi:hypothetical protein